MPNSIKIYNLDNSMLWEKSLTNEEFTQVKSSVKGERTISTIPATLRPVRTNNLKNFSKDFFLPTTVNHAIKVQHAVLKVFVILASLVLDVLTFPIRLLTCIPRVISNPKQERNIFYKYLLAEGLDPKQFESSCVKVRLDWEIMSPFPTSSWTTADGVQHYRHSVERRWLETMVNFVEMPTYEGYDVKSSGMSS